MEKASNRTPIVLGIVAGVLLVAIAVLLVIYLQRSAPDVTASPEQSSEAPADGGSQPAPSQPAPSQPAETDAPPAATEAGLEVSGTGFTVTQADGTTFTHEWADDPQAAVTALTELFGAPPAEEFQNGDAQNWAYDIYVWEGFRLYDVFLEGSGRQRTEVPAPTYAQITANTSDEVAITDEFGVEVGMTSDEVTEIEPDAVASGTQIVLDGDGGRNGFYQDGSRDFAATVDTDAAGEVVAITYAFRTGGL